MNQLLAEMDGFDTSKGLLVLAATNRPEVLTRRCCARDVLTGGSSWTARI